MRRSEQRAARKRERQARRKRHSPWARASLLVAVGAGVASPEELQAFQRLPAQSVPRRRRERRARGRHAKQRRRL